MSSFVQPSNRIAVGPAIATSSTRTQLPGTGSRTVFLRAKKTNSAEVYVGDVTVTSAPGGNIMLDLQPGEGIFLDISSPGLLYVVSAAAQTVYATALGGSDV